MSRCSTVLLAALCSLILLTGSAHPPRHNEVSRRAAARSALAAALGQARPLEGRLVGFPHAPFDRSRPRISKSLRSLLRDIEAEAAGTSPRDIATRALAKLIGGRTRQAIEDFERAVAAAPDDAAMLSDLSVAYLADARENREPASLVKALESAERAVELDPELPCAVFNRALALGKLGLGHQARTAWKEYLRIDPDTPWRQKAERHRNTLSLPDPVRRWEQRKQEIDEKASRGDQANLDGMVALHPQSAREYAEEKLLGAWAEAWGDRDEEASPALATARAIGAALEKHNGDRMTAAAVGAIDQALSDGGRSLAALVQGHRAYQEGLGLYIEGRFQEAEGLFARAEELLDRGGSPFTAWATFRLAVCRMQLFHYDRALAMLAGVQANAAASGFKSLEGRSRWVHGLSLGILAKPAEALASYHSSARAFASIQEAENLGVVNSLIAEVLRNLGDLTGAWRHHAVALKALRELREPARRQLVLEQASETALRMEKPLTAILFLQEALAASPSSPNSAAWFYCLWMKALGHARLGRMEEAWKDLRQARLELTRFPDEKIRNSFLGDLLAMEGRVLTLQNPGAALDRLSKAIRIYQDTNLQDPLALLYAERARSYLALGHTDQAEQDFSHAIEAIRKQRAGVEDESLRAAYLNEFRTIFEDMVELQARLGREALALDYAESARAQVLLELVTAAGAERSSQPLKSSAIQKRLSEHVAIVEYSVLPQKLLAWVLRRDSLVLVQSRASREEIERLVKGFHGKIMKGGVITPGDPEAKALFHLLIGRLQPALEGAETLVVVPDRDLHGLPFAALRDPQSGRYLIERYALAISPSANLYIEAVEHARVLDAQPFAGALVIGDPKLDREILPQLSQLRRAESEARDISALYPGARLLTGASATRRAFLEGLSRYSMIHFAGHAVSNPADPLASLLALAPVPGEGDSGILYARELYRRKGLHARLVVLSACSGLSGGSQSGEGVLSLARPFLGAGVPAVVGSLWKADDRATAELMMAFHRRLLSDLSAADSLRQAQLDLALSTDPVLTSPIEWAGFQIIGEGSTP